MSKGIRDFFVYGIIVAGILVVSRPGSNAAGVLRAIGQTATGFVQAITGQKVTAKGVKG